MKELIQHIKDLLQENECVIIPDFGGFITYYASACYNAENNTFLPPYRTLGFNPLLQINDGLLVQSYMWQHDISYPAAMRMVENATNELREELNTAGYVQLPGLGILNMNIEGNIVFQPEEKGIDSPSLYGLSVFEMKSLKQLALEKEKTEKSSVVLQNTENEEKHNTLVININRTWLNNVVAIAAAVLLFFFLSTPVDNTYVEPESYASLGNAGWFEQIKTQSLATTLMNVTPQVNSNQQSARSQQAKDKHNKKTQKIHEEKIQLVKGENITPNHQKAQAANSSTQKADTKVTNNTASVRSTSQPVNEKPVVKQQNTTQYHIIVASVGNRSDAETVVKQLASKGYSDATIIERDKKVRVAIMSSSDKNSLNNKLTELRKNEMFKNAWMLTTRP